MSRPRAAVGMLAGCIKPDRAIGRTESTSAQWIAEATKAADEPARQLKDVEKQIEQMPDRILDASDPRVVRPDEGHIEELETRKCVLAEHKEDIVPPKGRLEDCIEPTLTFLSSPWSICKNWSYPMRMPMTRMAIAEPLRHCADGVRRTPRLPFPFRKLENIIGQNRDGAAGED